MPAEPATSPSPGRAATPPDPVVSAIVVSYNTRDITLRCLASLTEDLRGFPAEVFVVDNASADGSPDEIARQFPQVRLLANAANEGFGAANNRAMALARGEFILLINSDAFPSPGAVPAMIDCLRRRPDTGVVGPRLVNADGSLQRSCFRFPSPVRCWMENLWIYNVIRNHPRLSDYAHWPHDTERDVDFVIGACLLVRRDVVRSVGAFDPAFFMYSEEIDWQRRIGRGGWRVTFVPGAVVTHLGGASGATEQGRIKRHFFDSLDLYELKHHGLLGLISMRAAMLVGCSLRAVLWALAYVASPPRRPVAARKAALHLWLCRRQATCWRVGRQGRLVVHASR